MGRRRGGGNIRLILALGAEKPRKHTQHDHTHQPDKDAPTVLTHRVGQHIWIHREQIVHNPRRHAPHPRQPPRHHPGHRGEGLPEDGRPLVREGAEGGLGLLEESVGGTWWWGGHGEGEALQWVRHAADARRLHEAGDVPVCHCEYFLRECGSCLQVRSSMEIGLGWALAVRKRVALAFDMVFRLLARGAVGLSSGSRDARIVGNKTVEGGKGIGEASSLLANGLDS